jgi:hypothetical protein
MTDLSNLPATALTMPEREWLRDQAAELGPKALIIHIGVDRGASLHCSRAGNKTATIIGIDLQPNRFEGKQDRKMGLVKADSSGVTLEQSVDFLFVDGDHSVLGVTTDIETWIDRVTGVIAFHDYGWGDLYPWVRGVKVAVDAWDWTDWEPIDAPDSIRAYRRKAEEK